MSDRLLRVLLFSTTSRSIAPGGMERVVASLAHDLRRQGHTVVEAHAEPAFDHGEAQWGVRLRRIQTWNRIPTPRTAGHWAVDTLQLRRWLHAFRPDVVNAHFVTDQVLPFLALRRSLGYRLALTCHGSDVLRPASALARAAVPILLRHADAVIAVSRAVANRIRDLAPTARPSVIYNGIDLDFWTPAPALDSRSHGRIVQVGRLHPVKGQDVLLRALPRVREHLPEVTVTFVGEGPEQLRLEALAADLGVRDAVTFAGAQTAQQVLAAFRQATVNVMPSRSEGLPLALLEAMAVGVPTVASSVGGIPEAAGTPSAATLVPPETPDALAEALIDLLTHDERQTTYRTRGRERAAMFSWTQTVEDHIRVLSADGAFATA